MLRGLLAELVASPSYTEFEDDFVSVVLTDTGRPEGAMDQLRRRFPHVLVLAFEPEGRDADAASYRSRVAGRDDLAVAAEFVGHVRNSPVTEGERKLLAAAFDDARRAEAADGDA